MSRISVTSQRDWRNRQREWRRRLAVESLGPPTRWSRLHRRVHAVSTSVLSLLFPPNCSCCGRPDTVRADMTAVVICGDCERQLVADQPRPACRGCGLPRSRWAVGPCPHCRRARFAFTYVVPLGYYRGPLRAAAIRMKRFHEYPLTIAVGYLLAESLQRAYGEGWETGAGGAPASPPTRPVPGRILTWESSANQRSLAAPAPIDVIVPIPKFWVKRILRGTNTSEVLAGCIARKLQLPVAMAALRSVRSTRKQSLLGQRERRRNVTGAFQVARGYDFRDARVLLVDDIMTTGSTANEAARMLLKRGARAVGVAVAARAVTHQEG